MQHKMKLGLLTQILIAIALGLLCSTFFPEPLNRIFITINGIFSNFLGFAIPLIIIGLVVPGIAELGKGAGKLLAYTAIIAYLSTLISGFFSYFTCSFTLPLIIDRGAVLSNLANISILSIKPYFTIDIPPMIDVTTALVLSFMLGLGLSNVKSDAFKNIIIEFREVIVMVINKVIVPFLPIFIFGIFLKIGAEGQASVIIGLFFKVIALIFAMHVILLLFQFSVAGLIAKRNPIKALLKMLPAYFTALGTQSSAATIPVTLSQTKQNGVDHEVADFVIPLCATIHLAGSMLKIVACSFAIMYMMNIPAGIELYFGFILMLGITMVAAPGVPGGAIMAAIGILQSMLGFDQNQIGLMIALYITMDSFGTACNVTGDGAIAIIMNKIYKKIRAKKA